MSGLRPKRAHWRLDWQDCCHGNAGPRRAPDSRNRCAECEARDSTGEVLNNVKYGSPVYTDDAVPYDNLKWRYIHETVNHAETYVKGRVHTNGLENFWSLLKRGLKGTYVAVEPFHLERYIDEQVFRYNNRATKDNPLNDSDRFCWHSLRSPASGLPIRNSLASWHRSSVYDA